MSVLAAVTDLSAAETIIERAVAEARLRDERLFVAVASADAPTHEGRARTWGEQRDRTLGAVERLRADLADRGVEAEVELAPGDEGDPATWLLQAAERSGATLMVIGVRPRSPVGKLVLGSITQDVLLRADAPVLAVRVEA